MNGEDPSGSIQPVTGDDGQRQRYGGEQWWNALVDAWSPTVWTLVTNSLDLEDAREVYRLIWLRLADRIGDLTVESAPEWLLASTRREVSRAVAFAKMRPDSAA
jgi:hypothetical protein